MKRVLALVAVVCLFASACGNDDDSPADGSAATEAPATATQPAAPPEPTEAPEPAATPAPTEAPEPAATPAPTEAPEPAQPAETMQTLAFNMDTTGGDVADRLSDAERECTQDALGDDYGLLVVTPLASLRETGTEAGLLGCMTHDNVLLVGSAILDTRAGGRSPETSECLRELHSDNPSSLYQLFGLEWEGASPSPEENREELGKRFQCMNSRERSVWVLGMWNRVAAVTLDRGRDFVDLLSEGELQCASDAVGEETAEELLDQNPLQVWRSYPAVHDCFPPGTLGKLFTQFTANQIGGMSDSTFECMVSFSAQRPEMVIAIADGPSAELFEDDDAIIQFGIDIFGLYGCMTTEERETLQGLFLTASLGG